jgi:hypothetical protein
MSLGSDAAELPGSPAAEWAAKRETPPRETQQIVKMVHTPLAPRIPVKFVMRIYSFSMNRVLGRKKTQGHKM